MGIWSLGLGRARTKLGAWMDRKGITQADLHKWSGVSRPTITKLCSDREYSPSALTKRMVVSGLIKMGYDVYELDFW